MDQQTESFAAETLLERGVRVPIPTPFFFKWFGKKRMFIRLYQPYFGTLLRISRYYLSTGVTAEQLKEIEHEAALKLCAVHGPTFCKIIAVGLLNGFIAGALFTRPLAWCLRWSLKPEAMCALTFHLVVFGGTADFMNIIRSVKLMKITEPNLSQKSQGS